MVQHQNSLVHHTLPWTVDMPRGHAEAISKPPRTFKPEPLRPMATTRTDQFLWLATKPIDQIQYHLVMTNSLPWKIHPFLSSVNHLYKWAMASMAMLNNQRVPILDFPHLLVTPGYLPTWKLNAKRNHSFGVVSIVLPRSQSWPIMANKSAGYVA